MLIGVCGSNRSDKANGTNKANGTDGGYWLPVGTEGDGTPSVWLSADDENTSISSQGYFGFEIDGCGVDATVALYCDVESVATLIGGESGVLDIEELCI